MIVVAVDGVQWSLHGLLHKISLNMDIIKGPTDFAF